MSSWFKLMNLKGRIFQRVDDNVAMRQIATTKWEGGVLSISEYSDGFRNSTCQYITHWVALKYDSHGLHQKPMYIYIYRGCYFFDPQCYFFDP